MVQDNHSSLQSRAKRLRTVCVFWFAGLALLVLRLLWIVLIPAPSVRGGWGGAGVSRWQYDAEHLHLTMTTDGRGQILFRDGRPWSHSTVVRTDGHISPHVHTIAPELLGSVGRPGRWPDRRKIVPEEGRNGLEEAFDSVLSAVRPGERGYLHTAAVREHQQRATEATFELSSHPGATVVTTLSLNAEERARSLLAQSLVPHASIVSISLPKREILVLASADHRRSDALHAIAPGSVFKLVTTAAALETHRIPWNQTFDCDGTVHIPHVRMNCWRAHGHLSLIDALRESCDVTFATIGTHLGRRPFEAEAERFGLYQTGLGQFEGKTIIPGAEHGVVFRRSGADAGLLANTAIGQEDVRMTPLEGALLAATIADEGKYQPARMVKEIKSGKRLLSIRERSGGHAKRACHRFTANLIKQGMWQVVHSPTGTLYRLHGYPIYAKSGTAEVSNGRVNAWIVGFREQSGKPVEAFAFTVENEPSATAHKVLYQLAQGWLSHVERK